MLWLLDEDGNENVLNQKLKLETNSLASLVNIILTPDISTNHDFTNSMQTFYNPCLENMVALDV